MSAGLYFDYVMTHKLRYKNNTVITRKLWKRKSTLYSNIISVFDVFTKKIVFISDFFSELGLFTLKNC